jgi:YVTN family beta-propeller protein
MGRRLALLIATYQYEDRGLRELAAPAHDTESLAAVLADRDIAGFEVTTLINEPHYRVGEAIGGFYRDRRRDDLTLLYFTGHGLKDDGGRLYLAMANTRRDSLLFSALSAEQIDQAMEGCPSRQKVLILDCCYSGAYPAGWAAKADPAVHALERFQGRGRTVLTAADATQYAFEGDRVRGDATRSVFTRHLVGGLRDGSADLDGDGDVTLDELYSYVYDRVVEEMPQQRPKKQDNVEGRTVIARNINWSLPAHLRHAIASPIAADRLAALEGLDHLYRIGNDLVRDRVREQLRQLRDDDSKQVSAAAAERLGALVASPAPTRETRVSPVPETPVLPVPESLVPPPAAERPTPSPPHEPPPPDQALPDQALPDQALPAPEPPDPEPSASPDPPTTAPAVEAAVEASAAPTTDDQAVGATGKMAAASEGLAVRLARWLARPFERGRATVFSGWRAYVTVALAVVAALGAIFAPAIGDFVDDVVDLDGGGAASGSEGPGVPSLRGLAVSPDGRQVYVPGVNGLAVIDTKTNAATPSAIRIGNANTISAAPSGGVFSPDGDRIYLLSSFSDGVAVLDTETDTVTRRHQVGGKATDVAVSPDGRYLYVPHVTPGGLSMIDTKTNTTEEVSGTPVPADKGPVAVAVSPKGHRVFVASLDGGIVALDAAPGDVLLKSHQVSAPTGTDSGPTDLAVSADGRRLYVPKVNSRTVSVIDTTTNRALASITTSDNPGGVAVSPSGRRLYVASHDGSTVSVFDTKTYKVVGSPIATRL